MRRFMTAMTSAAMTLAVLVPLGARASAAPITAQAAPTAGTIVNGVAWNDTANHYIGAHLGSAFQAGSTYYWCGAPWNPDGDTDAMQDHGFYGIRCYSSTNLSTWTDRGTALEPDKSATPNPYLTVDRHVERPKVVYNADSGLYVMWFHDASSTYKDWTTGVATSKTPTGPYTWVADKDNFRGCGTGTGDMTLYQEGNAVYFVHTTTNNADVVIQKLSDDYLRCASPSDIASLGAGREAPQLVRADGTYFLFESGTNWWAPSQGVYRTATSLSGPWSAETTFGSRITADSQGDDIIPVHGTLGTTYVMMADRLQGAASGDHHWNVNQSQYVWLPLTFSGTTVRMDYLQSWSIDTATGLWSTADPHPCDLSQVVDFETGTPNDVGGTGASVLSPQTGSWQVTSSIQPTGNLTNKIYQHTSNEGSYSYGNAPGDVFQNYYVQAFASRATAATEVSVAGRLSPSDHNHFYTLTLNGRGWAIYLDNGGTWTTLAGGSSYPQMATPNTWYLMRLVMDGPNISGWISTDRGLSFVQLGSATDSTLTSGTFAVASAGGWASFDSLSACAFPTRTAPPPAIIPTVITMTTSANPATRPKPVLVAVTVTAGGRLVTSGSVTITWPGMNGRILLPLDAQGQVHVGFETAGLPGQLPIGTTAITATYLGTDTFGPSQAVLAQSVGVAPPVVTPDVPPAGRAATLSVGVTPSALTLSGNYFDRAPLIVALDQYGRVLATHQAVSFPHFDVIWTRPSAWSPPLPGDTVPLPPGTASFLVTVRGESRVLTESLAGLLRN